MAIETFGVDRFSAFFEELNEVTPFPWQQALVERLLTQDWPQVIDVPTSSGKTAVLDCLVFAMAAAHLTGAAPMPRRIFFCVDRRLIVDEAFERAHRIAANLTRSKDCGPTAGIVAEALAALAGSPSRTPLKVVRLRGGVPLERMWIRSPLQPAVICTTVDQLGSRLLFRGYGVSSGMLPIHAALTANDSVIILDEAHCSKPFEQTLSAIARFAAPEWREDQMIGLPFQHLVMTATPVASVAQDKTHALSDTDRRHPVLSRRLAVAKTVELIEVKGAKAAARSQAAAFDTLAAAVRTHVAGYLSRGMQRIAVIVNRVPCARRIANELRSPRRQKDALPCLTDVVLMTGRMRPFDRDDIVRQWNPYLKATATRAKPERPVIIVATQCLEVGANFDFDAMLCECASLDALRQRFGRLNRLGNSDNAPGAILIREDQVDKHDDPVYGTALSHTWQWLKSVACAPEVQEASAPPVIDFGINAMNQLVAGLTSDQIAACTGVKPDAPTMMPAYLDAWVQTAPPPMPDPDIDIFLHGPQRAAPEIQVCWRSDLLPDMDREQALEVLELSPPVRAECLAVPIHALRRFLCEGATDDNDADVDAPSPAEPAVNEAAPMPLIVVWRHSDSFLLTHNSLYDLRPGDVCALPAVCRESAVLADFPYGVAEWIPDIHEQCLHRAIELRLHRGAVSQWPHALRVRADVFLDALERDVDGVVHIDDETAVFLRELLTELQVLSGDHWLGSFTHAILRERKLHITPYAGGSGLFISAGAPTAVEDARDRLSIAKVPVTLSDHCQQVKDIAREFAEGIGLSDTLVKDLTIAAYAHDLGKCDPRFQAWLLNGNRFLVDPTRPLAKSPLMRQTVAARDLARRNSGYPSGARHEMLSVALLENPATLAEATDLVRYLIASHHGHARPFAPVVIDDSTETASCSMDWIEASAPCAHNAHRLDSGHVERFWRLVRRYGWWRLAMFEAIIRLADHAASETPIVTETENMP